MDTGQSKKQNFLSVVLPNYNHGHLLARAVGALRLQELQPDEIILIDDASTDASVATIEQLAATMPTLRVLRNPSNIGAIATLQKGLELATGRHIYFAAADDWVMPGFFALAADMLDRYPQAGLFAGEADVVDGPTGRPLGKRPIVRPIYGSGVIDPQQALRLLARSDNWVVTGSTVFRREAVLAAGGFDSGLGSYADGFVARKIMLTRGFCFAPQTVSTWCVFPDSASRTSALDLNNALRALEIAASHHAADPTFPRWYPALFGRRWRFATSRLALYESPENLTLILAMGARSPIDRNIVSWIWQTTRGRLRRLVMLAWLWIRLRPYWLPDLLKTHLARSLASKCPKRSSQRTSRSPREHQP